ncbi:MAG: hypothetical protein R3293_20710 [Candidatus Promineifilaceae bacterium]|nr:hypothetical protein [Candidatus Promineifilaceae bacterium]
MNTYTCYHIHVNGRLDERWLGWFEGHKVVHLDNGQTLIILTGVDQPALFGVLNRIRDLGLELISVQKDNLRS